MTLGHVLRGKMPPKQRKSRDLAITSDSDTEGPSVHGKDYHASLINPHKEPAGDRMRRRSFIEEDLEDEEPLQIEIPVRQEKKEAPITWMSLPRKGQLAILVTARLSEPLVQSSLRVSCRSGT